MIVKGVLVAGVVAGMFAVPMAGVAVANGPSEAEPANEYQPAANPGESRAAVAMHNGRQRNLVREGWGSATICVAFTPDETRCYDTVEEFEQEDGLGVHSGGDSTSVSPSASARTTSVDPQLPVPVTQPTAPALPKQEAPQLELPTLEGAAEVVLDHVPSVNTELDRLSTTHVPASNECWDIYACFWTDSYYNGTRFVIKTGGTYDLGAYGLRDKITSVWVGDKMNAYGTRLFDAKTFQTDPYITFGHVGGKYRTKCLCWYSHPDGNWNDKADYIRVW